MYAAVALAAALLLLLAACGSSDSGLEALSTRMVRLPGGTEIRAEALVDPNDQARGMMYRESLPRGRGLLFLHDRAAMHPYWMFNVKVPLDIIWMDNARRIVYIAENVPPCPGPPNTCPAYGAGVISRYVLELAGGEAKRLGLNKGDTLQF